VLPVNLEEAADVIFPTVVHSFERRSRRLRTERLTVMERRRASYLEGRCTRVAQERYDFYLHGNNSFPGEETNEDVARFIAYFYCRG